MTTPAHHHSGYGNPVYCMEKVAVLGVAHAWNQRAKARRAQAQVAGVRPSNLLDDPQHPANWDAYIGQAEAKRVIRNAILRAADQHTPVQHILIADGEPGIDKTALAVLGAREIGTRSFTISGTPTKRETERLLNALQDGDVLFIEKIHRLVRGGKG